MRRCSGVYHSRWSSTLQFRVTNKAFIIVKFRFYFNSFLCPQKGVRNVEMWSYKCKVFV